MKIKNIIPAFIAVAAAMFTGCSENNDPTYLGEIRVSQSYVSLPANGGASSITVTTTGSWNVKTDLSYSKWLTINPAQGGAGTTTISFSANAASASNTATVILECDGKTQEINVQQITEKVELPVSTCAEVVAGEDGKTFRVKGTCTAIANTTYGNWYLNDGTEEVYIYGTLDAKGAEKNFLSLGIEVGDILTVEGPKTTYNGTVELVNVTVLNIEKSLIKADSVVINGEKNDVLPLEGGDFEIMLTNKCNGISVDIPADAQSWLSVLGIQSSGNASVVKFRAAANTGGDRNTTLTFKTTDGKKDYSSQIAVSQKGAIVEGPISGFLAAAVGDTQFRLTGVITELYASDKQGKSFYIADYSGKTLIYRVEGFIEAGAKVGDVVTVVGKRGAYKDSPQMVSGTFEKLQYAVTEVTIADFLTKADAKDVYYKVSGTVAEIANDTYGNLYISDGTNKLYVYGCYPGWGATGDARKGAVAANNIAVGDKLTVIGVKSTYNGTPQVNGGIFFAVEKAE